MDKQEYLDLIPMPNAIQPKFMAWVEANLQPYLDTQAVLNSFTDAFDITKAVGKQLDILGEILGVSRLVNFKPGGGISALLEDELYRLVLTCRIILNQWKGTKDEIYDFWQTFLPEYPVLIVDNQDMTMNVLVVGVPASTPGATYFAYDSDTTELKGYDAGFWEPFNNILRDLILNDYFFPKPAGVSVSYTFLDTAVFAYDQDSEYLKGYDAGEWVSFS